MQLGVVFQLRFLDACQEVREAMAKRELGEPVQFDCYMKFHRPQEYYTGMLTQGGQGGRPAPFALAIP